MYNNNTTTCTLRIQHKEGLPTEYTRQVALAAARCASTAAAAGSLFHRESTPVGAGGSGGGGTVTPGQPASPSGALGAPQPPLVSAMHLQLPSAATVSAQPAGGAPARSTPALVRLVCYAFSVSL
jgi:hypothetical protein